MDLLDTFFITLSAGTVIYRAFNDKNNIKGNWYSYDIDNVRGYGNRIGKFVIQKDVKLVNLTSGLFHIHYMDKLNLLYTGTNYDGVDDRKYLAMAPIGLPNIEAQFEFLKLINIINLDAKLPDSTSVAKIISDAFYNKARISEYDLDKHLINAMTTIYKDKCDGFTLPIRTFNRITNNFFLREIYFYDADIVKITEYILPDSTIKQHGGHSGELLSNINTIINNKYKETKNVKEYPKYIYPSDIFVKRTKEQIEESTLKFKKYAEELNKLPVLLRDTREEDYDVAEHIRKYMMPDKTPYNTSYAISETTSSHLEQNIHNTSKRNTKHRKTRRRTKSL
jgi:hypothetical protein